MLKQTREFNPTSTISRIKGKGMTVNMNAIAADIRHNHTNYDEIAKFLSTDKAEYVIIETYKIVVSINNATAHAMKVWAQDKMKGLA